MSSQRFPGKVLSDVLGSPMLGHLLDRLDQCKGIDGLVVATSNASDDDAVAAYATDRGIACHRGSLEDVASRMIGAAEAMGADALVRVSGDSPLLDPALVDEAVRLFRDRRVDLVTNVQKRTFPKGQSVEVVSLPTLHAAWSKGMTADEREHVTKRFYDHARDYAIRNMVHEPECGDIQLSVDTLEDMRRVSGILGRLGAPYHRHRLSDILGILNEISRVPQCSA
jgi:spore coat polysaccharide biosynthesis protein SpsF